MSEPTVDRDPFEVVAESFLARFRAGERPSIEDLAARHPDPTLAILPGSVGVGSIVLLQGEGWTMSEDLRERFQEVRMRMPREALEAQGHVAIVIATDDELQKAVVAGVLFNDLHDLI